MATRWTEEQLEAINSEGENIIVSAGAGSGKTAVLSERVLRKLNSGVNIDELLILTFTKAAAFEMKERIRKKIKQNNSLSEQLNRIDSAYITTFDSYALSIVKRFHYILNVSKNVSIIESSVINIKKEEILKNIFDEYYLKEDTKFLKLISDFCLKDDKEIFNSIMSISNKLDLKYDKKEYLKNYIDNNFDDVKINNDIIEFEKLLNKKIEHIKSISEDLSLVVDNDYYNKVYDALRNLISAKNYDDIKLNLDVDLPRLKQGSDAEVKNLKSMINDNIKDLKNICVYESREDIKNSIYLTKDYVEIIIDIILRFQKEIYDYKFNNDMFEFNDIAVMAIKILKENSDIRDEIKYSLNEILIDEYQDTSDLQETFINLISNNNVYMVGDIKQSIYRFRNANPYLFKNKYDNYRNHDGGKKIDLLKNFRSRFEVLDNINLIFNKIMDDDIGGANYIDEHQMIFGNKAYIEEGSFEHDNNLEVYNYVYDKEDKYSKEEIEIFITAHDIQQKINSHYKIYDKDASDGNKVRDITYNDFVILIDRSTSFDLYKKIFEYLKIPLTICRDEKLMNGIDIYLIKNIITLIKKSCNNNFDDEFKYAFISVSRSYLMEMNDDDIFSYFLNKNYNDSILMQKINKISIFYNSITSKMLLDKILEEFDFYNKLSLVGNIEDACIRIEYLKNLQNCLNDLCYSPDDFLEYIDVVVKKEMDIKFTKNENSGNSVKIMTIHKSKGLEYHICYFPMLYKSFNILDLNDKFLYDNKYGIITPYINDDINKTIYKYLVKERYIKEEISEKIRLFYVALTRCKEKIILINSFNDDNISNNRGLVDNNIRNKYRSFKDILDSINNTLKPYIKNINIKDIGINKEYNMIKKYNYKNNINISNDKYIVNELKINSNVQEKKHYSKTNYSILSDSEQKVLQIGTQIHDLLEIIDFDNPRLEELNCSEFYKDKIKKFLDLDILKENNLKFYKEYEFINNKDNEEKHGIIDLIIEGDNDIKIIDYKLKNIDDEKYYEQLCGYKEYIKTKTSKDVNIYLYSILDNILEKK